MFNLIEYFTSFILYVYIFFKKLIVNDLNFLREYKEKMWSYLFNEFLSYFSNLIFIPYINIFLIFTTTLFFIGLAGLLFGNRNMIYLLICYEIISLSIVLDFFYASLYSHQGDGFVFGLIVISLAAIESTVGLSIIISFYRRYGHSSIYLNTKIKGK